MYILTVLAHWLVCRGGNTPKEWTAIEPKEEEEEEEKRKKKKKQKGAVMHQ